jgi:hypothetical protein
VSVGLGDAALMPADLTGLSKPDARDSEGLGRLHDGSDPK